MWPSWSPHTYTLSLPDALPILQRGRLPAVQQDSRRVRQQDQLLGVQVGGHRGGRPPARREAGPRSEEHTSELQSLRHLVCRLLLGKKKEIPCHHVLNT